MPSPDLLPKGRSFPSVAAPSLDNVLVRARRRRARHAGLVGVVAAAAVAATTFAFVPHESSDALRVVPPADPARTAAPAPSPAAQSTAGVVRHGPADATTSRKHDAPATLSTLPPKPQDTAAAIAPADDAGDPDRATVVRRTIGPPHRTTRYDPTRACTGTGPTVAQGWCSYYDGPTTGTAGETITLATAVCRLPGQGAASLVSRTGRQADFAVGKQAYRPVWRWSYGRSFAQSPTWIQVAAGTCVEWFVSWRVVDNAGTPLTPGKYYLDATPRVRPASEPDSGTVSSPISFTVR